MSCFSVSMYKRADNRIEIIDALRGISILLMVLYHFGFNMCVRGIWPEQILFNPLINTLQAIFAGIFIMLCGFSCRYSRNNLRRGVILILLALLVTVVSHLSGFAIYFGILHFLGCAVIIYAVLPACAKHIPPYIWLILFAVSNAFLLWINTSFFVDIPHLWIFGVPDYNFYTADYFPLFPWIFLFLFGTWFGAFTKSGRMPAWFYVVKIPFFPAVGRHTLIIYLLHQPVLYLIMEAGGRFL